jgi:hypothetical protein
MNGRPSLLKLLIVTQTFLLFCMIAMPAIVHYLHQSLGKLAYGCLAALCIVLTLLLRRALSELDA